MSIDQVHQAETVGYIVMERGRYTLPDGTIVEADNFETRPKGTFKTIAFTQPFQTAPVVLTAITSFNEENAIVPRLRRVNTGGFQYKIQQQERNTQQHAIETMAYIAWEPSVGTLGDLDFEVNRTQDSIRHHFQTVLYASIFIDLPVFLAGMKTTNGGDTANVRWDNRDFYGVDIKIDEEQSRDNETMHTTEVVGYILLGRHDPSLDTDGDGLTNIDEITKYNTNPAEADTDFDGIDDGDEVTFWGDAWDQDADNDGLINLLDPDSDNDGVIDGIEIRDGFDPADPHSRP